jgi:hypothetical protein
MSLTLRGRLALAALALVALVVPSAAYATTQAIPVRRLTLPHGGSGVWANYSVWDTNHTEVYPSGAANGDKHGTLRWESGGHYAAAQTTYMLLGARVLSGSPGRMQEGHTHPADDPYGWTPLTKLGGFRSAVAPFSIDWFAGSRRGFEAVIEPEDNYGQRPPGSGSYHHQIMTDAERSALGGQWVWLWVKIVWGRPDGTTPQTGSLTIWVAGEDTPRVNRQAIYTQWYGQGMVSFWQGTYWINGNRGPDSIVEYAGARFGRTPQEAYEDQPSFYRSWTDGGSGGTSTDAGTVEGNVRIPSSLAW